MDPVKLQKLIADYKASHPSVKHNTDAEIISIMCNDASVNKADAAQLSQLLAGSNNSVGDGFSRTTAVILIKQLSCVSIMRQNPWLMLKKVMDL